MCKQETTELLRLLEIYFDQTDFNRRNITSKDPVLPLLKKNLMKLGYWRNKKRTNHNTKGADSVSFASSFLSNIKTTKKGGECPF